MPNHVTNVLTINAYEHMGAPANLVDEILAAIKGETPFDFSKVVPMPAALNITSGSVSSDAHALTDDAEARRMLAWPWVLAAGITTLAELRAHLRKRYTPIDGCVTLDDFAALCASNIDKYGHENWYEWSRENWGTKWNAYGVVAGKIDDRKARITFDTAWSEPLPVMDALAKRFSQATFQLIASDEGNDNAQRYYWSEGKRTSNE